MRVSSSRVIDYIAAVGIILMTLGQCNMTRPPLQSARRFDWLVNIIWLGTSLIALYLFFKNTIGEPASLRWSRYVFFEWLINYSDGFVRRGLAGQLISLVARGEEVAFLNMMAFCIAAMYTLIFAIFAFYFFSNWSVRLLLALTPFSPCWLAISNSYFYRKEMLFISFILLAAIFFKYYQSNRSAYVGWALLGAIFFASVIFPFLHEGYIFYSIIPLGLIYYRVARSLRRPKSAFGFKFFIASQVSIFILLAVFKGGPETPDVIWGSLSETAKLAGGAALEGPWDEARGGIAPVGWSALQGLSVTLTGIQSGLITYYAYPLALVAALVTICARIEQHPVRAMGEYFGLFFFVFLSFSPLFVLGWDWGRWIFGIFIVSLTLVSTNVYPRPVFVSVGSTLARLFLTRSVLLAILLVASVFTRVPECCIRGSGASLFTNPATADVRLELKRFLGLP